MSHWASQYIGRPWARGAQGPEAFDCWSFTRFILANHFDTQVPELIVPENVKSIGEFISNAEEHSNWHLTDKLADGNIVLMARSRLPIHVGVVISAGRSCGILHCSEPSGVLFQSVTALKYAGWGRLTYYRHKSWA